MRPRSTTRWIGPALLGVAITAVLAVFASRITSEQISLASESLNAGDRLAPAVRSRAADPGGDGGQGDP